MKEGKGIIDQSEKRKSQEKEKECHDEMLTEKNVFGKVQDGGLEIRPPQSQFVIGFWRCQGLTPLVGGWREVEELLGGWRGVEDLQDLLDLLDLLQERWWKGGKTEEEWRITTSGRRCWIQYHKSGGDTSTHSIS